MERLRSCMEREVEKLGLHHPRVIQISQQLDELHNEWNRLKQIEEEKAYIIRSYTSKIREVAMCRV